MIFPFNAQQNTPWTINKKNNTNPCTHTHALWVNDLEDYSPNVIKHEKHNPLIDRKKTGINCSSVCVKHAITLRGFYYVMCCYV